MEDKKVYSIVGKVEIGTDEYRDLIEDKARAERSSDDYMHKYWSEQDKVRNLEKKIDALKQRADFFDEYLSEHKTVAEDWSSFLARKMFEGTENE